VILCYYSSRCRGVWGGFKQVYRLPAFAFLGSVVFLGWIILESFCSSTQYSSPLHTGITEGGIEMKVELTKTTATPNLVCHFCGMAKPPFLMVKRGLLRLCQDCLVKHSIDLVVKGCEENSDTVEQE
jgi:hypothetical protein